MMPSPAGTGAILDAQDVHLYGFSYGERRTILPPVTDVVSCGGCWLKERRMVSFSQVQFFFEMQLRSALDLYSALIAAGLELSQSSHIELTGLCTLRRHNHILRESSARVVSVCLEVSFLEESEFDPFAGGMGLA